MKRQSGIELLRGVLMLMIVFVHLTGNGVLSAETPIPYTEPNWLYANTIDAICYPAVNTFVLISGYFGIRLSLRRLLKLDIPVICYSVVLFFLFGTITFGGVVSSFIPILANKYWFLTAYFLLMLVSPLLNAFIDSRSMFQLKVVLLTALFLFVVVPSFSPFCLTEARGMDVMNFCVLYICGRSLAILNVNLSRIKSLLLYVLSTIIILSLTVLFAYKFGVNNGWKSMFYAYNNIFVYLQALGLFFFFKQIYLKEKVGDFINRLAPSFFFVYIIHSCPVVSEELYTWISSAEYYYSDIFIFHTIGWAFIIFFSCLLIDLLCRRCLIKPIVDRGIEFVISGVEGVCKKYLTGRDAI